MKYFVTVAERTWEVEITGEGVKVDGEPVETRLVAVPGAPLYHLMLSGGGSWSIAAEPEPGGKPDGGEVEGERGEAGGGGGGETQREAERSWIFGIGGQRLRARVIDERAKAIGQVVSDGRSGTPGESVVAAPMPGLIVRVEVELGQRVGAGAALVVVEAMKMQNELRAAREGVVQAVHVSAGQKVEKGTALVTLTHL